MEVWKGMTRNVIEGEAYLKQKRKKITPKKTWEGLNRAFTVCAVQCNLK